jgi:hypothetical protein
MSRKLRAKREIYGSYHSKINPKWSDKMQTAKIVPNLKRYAFLFVVTPQKSETPSVFMDAEGVLE